MSTMVWPWLLVHVQGRFGLPACCSMQPAHMGFVPRRTRCTQIPKA